MTFQIEISERKNWKYGNMENKGLRVNMGETKVMICGNTLNTIKPYGNDPCSVCRKGVGRNSIFCTSRDASVHRKCSGTQSRLVNTLDFKCRKCLGLTWRIEGGLAVHVSFGDQKLDVVESVVYFGDGLSPNRSSEVITIANKPI